MTYKITTYVEAIGLDEQGAKEAVAMCLEGLPGFIRAEVTEVKPEQMRIGGSI